MTRYRRIDLSRDLGENSFKLMISTTNGNLREELDLGFPEAQALHQALGHLLGPICVTYPCSYNNEEAAGGDVNKLAEALRTGDIEAVCAYNESRRGDADTLREIREADELCLGVRNHPMHGPCIVVARLGEGDMFQYASINAPTVVLGTAGVRAWAGYPLWTGGYYLEISDPAPSATRGGR